AGAKTPPPGQVVLGINKLFLTQERIVARHIRWVRVAIITTAHGVDQVAAEEDQRRVFSVEVKWYGSDAAAYDPSVSSSSRLSQARQQRGSHKCNEEK